MFQCFIMYKIYFYVDVIKITDISNFSKGNMKILDISGCYGIKHIPNLNNLDVFIRRY